MRTCPREPPELPQSSHGRENFHAFPSVVIISADGDQTVEGMSVVHVLDMLTRCSRLYLAFLVAVFARILAFILIHLAHVPTSIQLKNQVAGLLACLPIFAHRSWLEIVTEGAKVIERISW